jgi:hypothetical protein
MNEGGPQWVVYFFALAAVFWGVLAIRFLVAALPSSEK